MPALPILASFSSQKLSWTFPLRSTDFILSWEDQIARWDLGKDLPKEPVVVDWPGVLLPGNETSWQANKQAGKRGEWDATQHPWLPGAHQQAMAFVSRDGSRLALPSFLPPHVSTLFFLSFLLLGVFARPSLWAWVCLGGFLEPPHQHLQLQPLPPAPLHCFGRAQHRAGAAPCLAPAQPWSAVCPKVRLRPSPSARTTLYQVKGKDPSGPGDPQVSLVSLVTRCPWTELLSGVPWYRFGLPWDSVYQTRVSFLCFLFYHYTLLLSSCWIELTLQIWLNLKSEFWKLQTTYSLPVGWRVIHGFALVAVSQETLLKSAFDDRKQRCMPGWLWRRAGKEVTGLCNS